jgi:DNA modification methylase
MIIKGGGKKGMVEPYFTTDFGTVYHGDCLQVMKQLPDKSIDCVITSPPYWQLRDYGFSDQWGLEPTYQEYLNNLWALIDEIWRVLKDAGTVWVNLGDTYETISGAMMDGKFGEKNTNNQKFIQPKSIHKCLLLIPHRFAIGCIDRGWILRNDIIWAKRNAMPESVTDRFSKKHEYIFFMAKQQKYYFDLDQVRDKIKDESILRAQYGYKENKSAGTRMAGVTNKSYKDFKNSYDKGKNPGSVSDFWDINTKGSSDNHYAAYNFDLINKPIIAGCPEGGIILDPFCGTATTGKRALQLKRKFIGIDGKLEYCKIAKENLLEETEKGWLF